MIKYQKNSESINCKCMNSAKITKNILEDNLGIEDKSLFKKNFIRNTKIEIKSSAYIIIKKLSENKNI